MWLRPRPLAAALASANSLRGAGAATTNSFGQYKLRERPAQLGSDL